MVWGIDKGAKVLFFCLFCGFVLICPGRFFLGAILKSGMMKGQRKIKRFCVSGRIYIHIHMVVCAGVFTAGDFPSRLEYKEMIQ